MRSETNGVSERGIQQRASRRGYGLRKARGVHSVYWLVGEAGSIVAGDAGGTSLIGISEWLRRSKAVR